MGILAQGGRGALRLVESADSNPRGRIRARSRGSPSGSGGRRKTHPVDAERPKYLIGQEL
jgi:hypothetical protein